MAVHITALRVPAVVRNGSRAGAVLDCEYALGAREQRRLASETGLVVKWFLVGSGPAPVYQWIPGQRPQDFGALRGRVDLAFKVTGSDERGAHRALRIPTPTTDLSGEYKCSVSTFEDEDFMVKRMLVFAPEQSLEMSQDKLQENAVNVTCSARGVFPEPKLALYWSGGGMGDISE
ncbi:uncharacterized protein [Hetaerina americana]|uniref:uncharacterized protein n=1 Tax=Hetaerina americana TaxID=62018 RepID=UPI003A7F390C